MVTARVLKLNASYMPIDVISWQDAITLWSKGVAEIIESYEDVHLHSWKSAMECPAVIRLMHFVKPKKHLAFYKPFTRRNVYDRDDGKCQYCGKEISLSKMTFDHVIPKSEGGLTNWQNIVCSCVKCNSKKSNRTPDQAHMKILNKPYAPKIADSFNEGVLKRLKDMKSVVSNSKWRAFIYWEIEMDQD